jgi:hypothetical protein
VDTWIPNTQWPVAGTFQNSFVSTLVVQRTGHTCNDNPTLQKYYNMAPPVYHVSWPKPRNLCAVANRQSLGPYSFVVALPIHLTLLEWCDRVPMLLLQQLCGMDYKDRQIDRNSPIPCCHKSSRAPEEKGFKQEDNSQAINRYND